MSISERNYVFREHNKLMEAQEKELNKNKQKMKSVGK